MSLPHNPPPAPSSTETASHSLQKALREQQTLLDSAGVGIVFIRRRLIVRANQRFAEIFGYRSSQALVGENSASLYPNQDEFRALGRAAYPVVSQGKTYHCERLMRRNDGSVFWGRLTGTLINPQDTSEGSIWIVDDIDAQKNAQIQLDTALQEKQMLFDNVLLGIVFLRRRRLTHCNGHFEKMLGYGPGELIGSLSRRWYYSDSAWEDSGQAVANVLLQAGGTFEDEITLMTRAGTPIPCEVRCKLVDDTDPEKGTLWIVLDISERRRAQEALAAMHRKLENLVEERTHQLRETVENLHNEMNERKRDQERIYWLAHYDPLTGLPNRTLLAERSQAAINQAEKDNTLLAVVFIDLDHFKHVNDSLGHRVGDALLVAIAQRLRAIVREGDTVCRLGGDEFILLLPGADAHGAKTVAEKLLIASRQPYQINHHELTMAPSIGIALYPEDGGDFDTLNQAADVAMYRSKLSGRGTYSFFTPEMRAQSLRSLQLENGLRRALERNQFSLHYQPQISITDGKISGVEALLRWSHPEMGAISPAEFIPLAEDCGQILPIGEWVMRQALQQLKAWQVQGFALQTMAVNLSAVQFRQPQLPQMVARMLEDIGVPPRCLELELTEGVALDDPRMAIATMDEFHHRGIRLSIDDFGTGYSSLSQLKRFPISKLKIDQSFVRDLEDDSNDRAIVSAIIRMAQALDIETIAEGVETAGQLAFLREQGCVSAQGYYFGRPMPAPQLQALLVQRKAELDNTSLGDPVI